MQENNQMKEFIVNTEDRKTSISELYSNILEGDIILNPDFQRNYVYDVRRASRIIESILLEIPLPAIFANEEKDGTMEVIDGVQRLTSVVKFIKNEYKLEGLIILSELTRVLPIFINLDIIVSYFIIFKFFSFLLNHSCKFKSSSTIEILWSFNMLGFKC